MITINVKRRKMKENIIKKIKVIALRESGGKETEDSLSYFHFHQ